MAIVRIKKKKKMLTGLRNDPKGRKGKANK